MLLGDTNTPNKSLVFTVHRGFYLLPNLSADSLSAEVVTGVEYFYQSSPDGYTWGSEQYLGAGDTSKHFAFKHLELSETLSYRYSHKYSFADNTVSERSPWVEMGGAQTSLTTSLNLDAEVADLVTGVVQGGELRDTTYITNTTNLAGGFKFNSELTPPRVIDTLTLSTGETNYTNLPYYGTTGSIYTVGTQAASSVQGVSGQFSVEPQDLSSLDTWSTAFTFAVNQWGLFYNSSTPCVPLNFESYFGSGNFKFWNGSTGASITGSTPVTQALVGVTLSKLTGLTRQVNGHPAQDLTDATVYRKLTAAEFVDLTKYESLATPGTANDGYLTNSGFPSSPTITSTSTLFGGSLAASTTYYYWVIAVDSNGTEFATSVSSSRATTSVNKTIVVNFKGVVGAAAYYVYRSTNSTFPDPSFPSYLNQVAAAVTPDTGNNTYTYSNTGNPSVGNVNPGGLNYPDLTSVWGDSNATLPINTFDNLPRRGTLQIPWPEYATTDITVDTATTGGTLPSSGTYYYWVTAVNALGEFAIASAKIQYASGTATNSNTVSFVGMGVGATKYYIYRTPTSTRPTSGTYYKGTITENGSSAYTYTDTSTALTTNPAGRGYPLMLSAEQVTYTGKAMVTDFVSGTISPCLTGITRGANSTTPYNYDSGAKLNPQLPTGTLLPIFTTANALASDTSLVLNGSLAQLPSTGTVQISNEDITYTGVQRGSLQIASSSAVTISSGGPNTNGIYPTALEIPYSLTSTSVPSYTIYPVAPLSVCAAYDVNGALLQAPKEPSAATATGVMIGNISWKNSARSLQGTTATATPNNGTIPGISLGPIVPVGRTLVALGSVPLMIGAGPEPIWVSLAIKDLSISSNTASQTSSLKDLDTLATGESTKAGSPGLPLASEVIAAPGGDVYPDLEPLTLQPTVSWQNTTDAPVATRFEFFYFTRGGQYYIPPKNGYGASTLYMIF